MWTLGATAQEVEVRTEAFLISCAGVARSRSASTSLTAFALNKYFY
jgi:hypothetical protein